MKNIEEQADSSVLLDDQAVSDYLRQNPDFFIRNARAVEQMAVPHPVRAASLWSNGIWRGNATIFSGWKKRSHC